MKTVLLYGDSNTWGFNPSTGERYDHNTRWGGVCRKMLGDGWTVIEEGLNGRTTTMDDPVDRSETQNGLKYLLPCLLSHRPIDLVVIMLGTNNLKPRFHMPASDIALSTQQLIRVVRASDSGPGFTPPRVLLICPPPTAPLAGTSYEHMFAGAEEKSRQLAGHFERVAMELNVEYFNAGDVIQSSPVDAIHLEPEAHRALGLAVAERIRQILGA